jgi:hypothetical protein
MNRLANRFEPRIASLRLRIGDLSSLRSLVDLPPQHDIGRRQWSVLGLQLSATEQRLSSRLSRAARAYPSGEDDLAGARRLNGELGALELALAGAYTFFDTYMDVLTQRRTPRIGRLLAGCDVLAWSAMRRDHPALRAIEPPLVFCDRGFGASIVRERVSLPDGSPNPMPVIQIPYSRLREKPNLTSIFHEAGHQVLAQLGLTTVLPRVIRRALNRAGASSTVVGLFSRWSSEIGPDFWTFCGSGIAAAGGIREILALPPENALRVSWSDPHPPPYLRPQLAFELCRQQWGRGVWDRWELEWTQLYPLAMADREHRGLLRQCVRMIPVVAHALLTTRFRQLSGRRLADLWELGALAPAVLWPRVVASDAGRLNLSGLTPGSQLAVFRLLKERGRISEEALDALMARWLVRLGEERRHWMSSHGAS